MLHDRHRRLITIALEAAAPYGAALGGRNALAIHGLSPATSKVIDLVTSREAGPEAARALEKALRRAGYQAERYHDTADLENTHPSGRAGAAQWHVRKPEPHDHPPIGGVTRYTCKKCWDRDYLGLSRSPRSREAVTTDLGPVLHPEDAAGQKICDLARRGLVRDYTAAADLLDRYSPAQLIGFARRLDPSLDGKDFAGLARRLDKAPEVAFTGLGAVRPEEVPRLRERFTNWPRDARQADRSEHGDARERPGPGRQRPERLVPADEQRQQRPAPSFQPRVPAFQPRAQPSRPEPGGDTWAAARTFPDGLPVQQPGPGSRNAVSSRGRQREAARGEPEIGR